MNGFVRFVPEAVAGAQVIFDPKLSIRLRTAVPEKQTVAKCNERRVILLERDWFLRTRHAIA
jgi:hypothetical protein